MDKQKQAAVDSLASTSETNAERARVVSETVYSEQEMKSSQYKTGDFNEGYKIQIQRQVASIEAMLQKTWAELNDLSFYFTRGT